MNRAVILSSCFLIGCATSNDRVKSSTEMARAAPIVSAMAIVYSPTLARDVPVASPMAMGVVPTFLADAVTFEELRADVKKGWDPKFPPKWYYIGSDAKNHYAIGFFFLAPRKLYKIGKTECVVAQEQQLTADDSLWMQFNSLERNQGSATCFMNTSGSLPYARRQKVDYLQPLFYGEQQDLLPGEPRAFKVREPCRPVSPNILITVREPGSRTMKSPWGLTMPTQPVNNRRATCCPPYDLSSFFLCAPE